MAGYFGFSKSINAIIAESEGKMTASELAKYLGVDIKSIHDNLSPDEWHHTSCYYNETSYYDANIFVFIKGDTPDEDFFSIEDVSDEEIEKYKSILIKMQEETKNRKKIQPVTAHKVEVEWLTWGGTRKRPVAEEHKEICSITWKPGKKRIEIKPEGGIAFHKMIGANGLFFNGYVEPKEEWTE